MDTNVLKTFISVCEYSGFSAAAKKLRLRTVDGFFPDKAAGERTRYRTVRPLLS